MHAHFRDAFADRIAVPKIAMFGGADAMGDAGAANLVLQRRKPSVEFGRPKECDHGFSVSEWIRLCNGTAPKHFAS